MGLFARFRSLIPCGTRLQCLAGLWDLSTWPDWSVTDARVELGLFRLFPGCHCRAWSYVVADDARVNTLDLLWVPLVVTCYALTRILIPLKNSFFLACCFARDRNFCLGNFVCPSRNRYRTINNIIHTTFFNRMQCVLCTGVVSRIALSLGFIQRTPEGSQRTSSGLRGLLVLVVQ